GKIEQPDQEAWWLLEALFKSPRSRLMCEARLPFSESQQEKIDQWIHERVDEKKPLQYIIGYVPFCGISVLVRPPILIPRPETEEWTASLIKELRVVQMPQMKILDLCCGSGCIGLALADAFPDARVVGVDLNPEAVALACENRDRLGIANAFFVQEDLNVFLDSVPEKFDLVVSNPPYIADSELCMLPEGVVKWEDHKALFAPDRGLAFYKDIAQKIRRVLAGKSAIGVPEVCLEIGRLQGKEVTEIISKCGFYGIVVHKDASGQDRCVHAKLNY
ncbi:peptide chain release factor N(5)-glutamine methyltransferase, partial [bacterium]|nr:peptide chain release factor N(5)-glutamine methyltransferase [bacterium]